MSDSVDTLDPKLALPETAAQQEMFSQYLDKSTRELSQDYLKKVIQLAASGDSFTLPVRQLDPSGKKEKDPYTGEEEPVYIGWENKTYKRSKISSKDWEKIDNTRAEYHASRDPIKSAQHQARMYYLIAKLYLNMTYEDYKNADWEELRPILDACNFRTVYSLPYAPNRSST